MTLYDYITDSFKSTLHDIFVVHDVSQITKIFSHINLKIKMFKYRKQVSKFGNLYIEIKIF